MFMIQAVPSGDYSESCSMCRCCVMLCGCSQLTVLAIFGIMWHRRMKRLGEVRVRGFRLHCFSFHDSLVDSAAFIQLPLCSLVCLLSVQFMQLPQTVSAIDDEDDEADM
jgi:hypothetical protein